MIRHKKCFTLFVLFVLLVSELAVFEFSFVPQVYASGEEYDFVDQISNVDGVADVGTHSNFENQKATDSTYDTLTEANTGSTTNTTVFTDGFEDSTFTKWTDGGTTTWIIGTDQYHSGSKSAKCGSTNDGYLTSDNIDMSGATSIYISFWIRDHLLDNADGYFYLYDGATYDQIIDLNLITPTTEDIWKFYSYTTSDSQYFINTFRIRFYETPETNEICWIDDVTVNKIVTATNYQLDLEVQWIDANYTRANEELCIYTGSVDAENLQVDVRDGSSWTTIIAALSVNQWNNVSVSTYLTSGTFTIRFKATTETGDTSQSSWQIDCTLLHTWEEAPPPPGGGDSTYEDFTTYTEVEPADRLQETANHVDFYAWDNETTYLYKNYGAAHFDNFTHLIDAKWVDGGSGTNRPTVVFWLLSNDLGDLQGLITASKTVISVRFQYVSLERLFMYMQEVYVGSTYSNNTPTTLSKNTMYYMKITKSGTAFSVKVYPTTANRTADTNVIWTGSLTLHADHKFKYCMVADTYKQGNPYAANIDVENLDLQEAPSNQAPSITSLRLSSTTDTVNITSVNVNTWYDWEANITDVDTLKDLKNVTIRVEQNSTWIREGIVLTHDVAWEGQYVAEPSVLYEDSIFKMWYRGGASTSKAIGYATSTDGETWDKYSSNPVASGGGISSPCMVKNGAQYWLYVTGNNWGRLDLYIGNNETSFTFNSTVLNLGSSGQWDDSSFGNCFVWIEGSDWKMLYEAMDGGTYKIGLATSSNGINWTKSGSNPVLSNSDEAAGPWVKKIDSTYYVWYQSAPDGVLLPSDICRSSSTDLTTWTNFGGDYYPVFPRKESWEGVGNNDPSNGGQVADPTMIETSGKTWMWYDAIINQSSHTLALATTDYTIAELVKTAEDGVRNIAVDSPTYCEKGEYWFRYLNSTDAWEWYNGTSWTSTSNWINTSACTYPTKTGTDGWYLFRVRLSASAQNDTNWEFSVLVYDSALHTATRKFSKITVNAYVGQTYTRPANQSLPFSPTVTRIGSFQRSLSQIWQFLGSVTAHATVIRQVSQTANLQAIVIRLQTFMRTVPQAVSLIPSATKQLSVFRQPFQSVTVGTFTSRITTLFRTSTMISQVSAFTTAQRTVTRLPTVTLISTAIAERILQSQRSTSQLVQLLALTERTASFPRQATQTLILNFIQARTLTTTRSSMSVLNVVSQVTRQVTVTRTQPINILIGAITSQASSYQRSLVQTVNAFSYTSKSLTFPRNPMQTLSITFQRLRSIIAVRLQPQNIALTTLANRFATFPRTASQAVTVLATTIRSLNLPRAFSETLNIQAFSSTLRTFIRLQPQTFTVESTILRVLSASRTATLQVFLAMTAQKGAILTERTVSLMVSVASQLTRTATMLRSYAQTVSYQIIVSRQTVSTRLLTQTFTMVTATTRSLTMPRLAQATASVGSSISRILTANRQAPTTILTQLLTARTLNIQRQTDQPLAILSLATRTATQFRTLSQIFSITATTTRSLTLPRFAEVITSVNVQITRTLTTDRTVLANILSQLSPTRTLATIRQPQQILSVETLASITKLLNRQSTEQFWLTLTASRSASFLRLLAQPFTLNAQPERTATLDRTTFLNTLISLFTIRTQALSRQPTCLIQMLTTVSSQKQGFYEFLVLQTISIDTLASRATSLERIIMQSIQPNTLASRILELVRIQSAQVNLVSQATRNLMATRQQPISLLITALANRVATLQKQVSQPFSLSSFPIRTADILRLPTQQFQFFMETVATRTFGRLVSESIFAQFLATRTQTAQRVTSALIQLLSSSQRTVGFERLLTQPFSILATQLRSLTGTRQTLQTFSLIPTTIRTLSAQRQAILVFNIGSSASRLITLARVQTQQIVLALQTSRIQTFTRLQFQTFTLIPSTIRMLSAQRQAFQAFSISGLTSRLTSLVRTQTQQIMIIIQTSRTRSLARLVSETVTSQTSTLRLQALSRQGNILFQIMSTAIGEKAGFYERLISQALLMLPSASRSLTGSRQATQQFLLLAFTSRTMQPTRLITESIETLATTLRTMQTTRTTPLNVILTFQSIRTAQFSRVNLQSLIVETLAGRSLFFARLFSQTVTGQAFAVRTQALLRQGNIQFHISSLASRLVSLVRMQGQQIILGMQTGRTETAYRTVTSQFTILLAVTSEKTTFGIFRSVDLSIIVNIVAQRKANMGRTADALLQAIIAVSRMVYPLTEGIPSGPITTPNFEITIETFTFGMNGFANQLSTKTIIKFQPLDSFDGNITFHYWITNYVGTTRLAYENMTIQTHNTDRDPTLYTLTLSTTIFWNAVTNDHLIWHLNAEYNGITTNEIRVLFTPIPLLAQIKPFSIYAVIVLAIILVYIVFFKVEKPRKKTK